MSEVSPFVDKPAGREEECKHIRTAAVEPACDLGAFPRPTSGDEERYPDRIGNFSKTLPHNGLGEVEPEAYEALLAALKSGEFEDFEALQGGGTLTLFNPLGGLAFNMEGPDSPFGGVVNPPPALASAELAGQMAELYWMAVCRDVPFSEYDRDRTVAAAAEDLSGFPGYEGVTPRNLFRLGFPGTQDGPMVSQFLLKPFRYDGIEVEARTRVPEPVIDGNGIDFLTTYDEWLCAQRGFPVENNPFNYPVCEQGEQVFDKTPRFIHTVRSMGQNAGQDSIYSAYFRAAQILSTLDDGDPSPADPGNPYAGSTRQSGFATFGTAHLLMLVGSANKAERHTWYQKWNMHRFLRPEAFSGRVHNVRTGAADYPVHQRLLDSPVLDRVFDYNQRVNRRRDIGGGGGSYLLPMLFATGSPTHPSFPSGHAFSAGACVTILKAWFRTTGEDDFEIPDPVKPGRDGRRLEPYQVGKDGPKLTVGGELNKLGHNLSRGRDMSGVHWRADDVEGLRQGEEVALRILREARPTYPEPFKGFTLTKFDGTTITV
jgi:hypothetical protein